MPDYSKGQIYTIRNRNDDNKIYVGSTIEPLYKRFYKHKSDSHREEHINMKIYIEVNGDWTNWYIELYENYPCNSKKELKKREGEVIRLIGTLNSRIEGRNSKEYYIDNSNKIKEQVNQYRIENPDVIKERKRQYYIKNKDKINEKIKQYRIENPDKMKEKDKQYRLNKKIKKLKELGEATT